MACPRPLPASCGCLAAFMAAALASAPVTAGEWQRTYLEPAVQAWMGVVTLLAEDGEREGGRREGRGSREGKEGDRGECKGDCGDTCERCRGQRHDGDKHDGEHRRPGMHGDHHGHHGSHHPGPHHGQMHAPGHGHHGPMAHGHMGPPRPEGQRGDAIAMLHEISGRLARIERMLAARGVGGPPSGGPGRGEWHGGHRHEMSAAGRAMMEERMAKMKEAREKWEQASPEAREKMKQEWEARMKEGREKMQAAREKYEQASPEEREKMRQEWEARMKEGREKMERARAEQGSRPNVDEMKRAMERGGEEVRKRMEEAKAKMEEARKRFQEMESRVKELEGEVARLKKNAEKDD